MSIPPHLHTVDATEATRMQGAGHGVHHVLLWEARSGACKLVASMRCKGAQHPYPHASEMTEATRM